ncbi:MAG: hypothetical protein HKN62_07860 [Phycisphaerales bacterium]|nr:hypothetical protein [Phycisphaerales bacterium]
MTMASIPTRHILRVLLGVTLLVFVGCNAKDPARTDVKTVATSQPGDAASTPVPPTPPAPADPREKAETLWDALVAEDWAVVFEHQAPVVREGLTPERYAEWSSQNEPFRIHSYEIMDVVTEDEYGWVHVRTSSSLRRYPQVPPRDTRRWEKWFSADGVWYPVPRDRVDHYPVAPAMRDRDAEAALLVRVEEAWGYRQSQAWDRLYLMNDPEDRPLVPEGQFVANQSLTKYVSHDVYWVEVVQQRGIVRVEVKQKLSDPSLSKLPPDHIVINERWINRDGEWYIDIHAPGNE